MVELVYTPVLGTGPERDVGSTPTALTMLKHEAKKYMDKADALLEQANKCYAETALVYTEQAKVYVMMAAVAQGVTINAS